MRVCAAAQGGRRTQFRKLFFDQALPSAGLSSSVFTAKALEQRQVPDRVVKASVVLTLRMIGVDLAVALSATLLFRGFTFWLPMLPGYWSSRRVLKGKNLLGE